MAKIVRTIAYATTTIYMKDENGVYDKQYEGLMSVRECKKKAAEENAEYVSMSVSKSERKYEMDVEKFIEYATPIE